jgi:N-acetylmuramoyl-L-alanine amidase
VIPTYRKRPRTKRIILHASHTVPGTKEYLQQFLAAQGRGMGLIEIGYHYLILTDGHLVETRPHDTIGSHCPGYNKDSVGVCMEGGMEEALQCDCVSPHRPCSLECLAPEPIDNFSEAQWETLRSLQAYLSPVYGELPIDGHTDLGHHKHREAKCPPTSRRT